MASQAMAEQDISAEPPSQSAAAAPAWKAASLYALGLLFLLSMSNYLDRGILAILAQPIKQELRLQDWELGVIGGPAFGLIYSLAGIPIARLAERSNRVTLISIACGIWSAMTMVCGLASSFALLALARAGMGGAEGAVSPVSYSLVSDYFPPRQRGMALSLLMASSPCAQLVAPIAGGFIAMHYGWRTAFFAAGLPGLVIAILIRLTTREPRNDTRLKVSSTVGEGRFFADMRRLFAIPAFVWLFIASTFMMIAVAGTGQFTAMYLMRIYGLSLTQAGLITATGLGAVGIAGTFIGGHMADRLAGEYGRSYSYVCAIGALFAGIFFLVSFTSHNWPVAVAFLLLANLATSLKNGTAVAANMRLAPPDLRATSAAIIMFSVVVIGTSLGPLVVGVVSDMVAAHRFSSALGSFAAVCPGGRAMAGALASTAAACKQASAGGLRVGITAASSSFFLAAVLYWLAGRTIRDKLEE